MKPHKHKALIERWVQDVEGQVVISKSISGTTWCEDEDPSWGICYEYKVIPRKHLEVALAHLNEGAEVGCYCKGCLVTVTSPTWSSNKEYRIKPKKVMRWIAVDGDSVKFVEMGEIVPRDWQLIEIEVEE